MQIQQLLLTFIAIYGVAASPLKIAETDLTSRDDADESAVYHWAIEPAPSTDLTKRDDADESAVYHWAIEPAPSTDITM